MRCAGLLVLSLLGACMGPVKAPSAYSMVTYPCNDDALFQARIDACVASAACAGVAGFDGTLGGNAITVDAQLTKSVFELEDETTLPEPQLDAATGSGASDYFFFQLVVDSIGGSDDQVSDTAQAYSTARDAALATDELGDDLVNLDVIVIADGESVLYEAVDGTAHMIVEHRAEGAITARFRGSFGPQSELLSGCFMQRATERRLVSTE